MRKQLMILLAVLVLASSVNCNIYNSWLTKSCLGYNNYTGNILSITNGSGVVAVRANSIPCYTIGPSWDMDPSKPIAANTTTYFPSTPSEQTGTKTDVCLGAIGLFIDGVFIYNYWDANQLDAYVNEGKSFDSCWGHPNPSGYHIHVLPVCLLKQLGYSLNDTSKHSPLLGFMLDSYPIYGPVGYSDPTDSSSSLKFLKSSYKNYVYDSSYGDLDQYNGRWTVTPEYPQGTYAYYATYTYTYTSSGSVNATPAYPYLIGPKYYGKVSSYVKNTCTNNGISSNTTTTASMKSSTKSQATTTKKVATTTKKSATTVTQRTSTKPAPTSTKKQSSTSRRSSPPPPPPPSPSPRPRP